MTKTPTFGIAATLAGAAVTVVLAIAASSSTLGGLNARVSNLEDSARVNIEDHREQRQDLKDIISRLSRIEEKVGKRR